MLPPSTLKVDRRTDGVAFVTLDRPHVHNAFNDVLIAELTQSLHQLGADPEIRAVVLRGAGKSFSAGADLDWMQRASLYESAENLADAHALAELMHELHTLPKPTIAAVHGAAVGGGVGLVACCDIAVAAPSADFRLSEVRLGLIPAVIMPYLLAAIGPRKARRWCLTAERISAAEALDCGLVHQVAADGELAATVDALLGHLICGAPRAQAAAKDLIRTAASRPIDAGLIADTAMLIALLRTGDEGREGIAAFLDKRPPAWQR
jgi:methylglutaconyl-CoA hydratase